jgi:hypothetical protein
MVSTEVCKSEKKCHLPQQQSYRPIGELAKHGDLVFAPESPSHRFGRAVEVTTTHVTYRSIPSEREISIPAHWPAFWNVRDQGRCMVVQAPA